MNPSPWLRGCGIELGRFGVFVLAYSYVFSPLETGAALLSTMLGAVFATFLFNSLTMKFLGSRDERVLRRAKNGIRLEEGKLVAIHGPLEALGSTLQSPFRRRPCVAYSYWVGKYRRVEDGGKILAKNVRGFAYTTCAVKAAQGAVGIRGISFDTLEPFEEDVRAMKDARDDVRRYLDETHFDPDPGHDPAALRRGLRDLRAEWADPPKEMRCDWGDPEATLDPEHLASEKVVTDGHTVTAIGVYSSIPPELRSRGTDVLRLLPGDFEHSQALLRTDATSRLLIAVLMFLVSHAILIFVYTMAPRG